jgi:hypothetical protein
MSGVHVPHPSRTDFVVLSVGYPLSRSHQKQIEAGWVLTCEGRGQKLLSECHWGGQDFPVRVGSFRYTAVTRNTNSKQANNQNLRVFVILDGLEQQRYQRQREIAGHTGYVATQITFGYQNASLIESQADSHSSLH